MPLSVEASVFFASEEKKHTDDELRVVLALAKRYPAKRGRRKNAKKAGGPRKG